MSAHLVHLHRLDEYGPSWVMTCNHTDDDPAWICHLPNGDPDPNGDGCWLMSWWAECGADLLDIDQPIRSLPIPVRPCDTWDYENGGTLTLDESDDPTLTLAAAATEYAKAVVAGVAAHAEHAADRSDANYAAWTIACSVVRRAMSNLLRAALVANGVEP